MDIERIHPRARNSDNIRVLRSTSYYQTLVSEGLAEFANWAFGPRGIQSLRLILFGDFCWHGEYKHTHVLLERASELTRPESHRDMYFRIMRTDAEPLLGFSDKYKDAMEACPSTPLLDFFVE